MPPPAGRPDYLFVMTYGRSGSTLLQAILNSVPGYLIRGENHQALKHLHSFHASVLADRRTARRRQRKAGLEPGSSTSSDAWYGIDGVPPPAVAAGIRRLVTQTLLRPEPTTRVTGFKEIRWYDDTTADFVAWLRTVFPGARFVLNTRRLEDVARSAWWADDADALTKLAGIEERLLGIAAELGPDAHRVHYDDYVADPATLEPLFAWLGEPFDLERVRDVLDRRHSY